MAFFPIPALALLFGLDAPVTQTGPAVFRPSSVRRAASAADLVGAAPRLPAFARHGLPPLSAAERIELEARSERRGGMLRRKVPALKIGVTRSLPSEAGFEGVAGELSRGRSREFSGGLLERLADGRLVWTAAFSSEGAGALRLHVRTALLPAGSRVYVYSGAGEVHGPYAFDSGTRPEGFWTNTVFAPEVFLEAQIAAADADALARARLVVDAVGHLEHPGFAPSAAGRAGEVRPKSQTCFVDVSCVTTAEFPGVDDASHAVGQLTFEDGGSFFVCSGGLLNSDPQTFTPYLLTANHCFSTQASATSLEAIWNYRTSSCNGPAPNPSLFPRTLGSTLLATGETSDFTLVELSQDPPGGSVFLGWTTADFAHAGGTVLHRLSYPGGDPQIYTREEVSQTPDPVVCVDATQGNFIYEKDTDGGTGGGSSGSPVYTADLRVVGQEFGACGTNVDDDCDVVSNSTLDGAFRVSFPALQPWLAPAQPGPCIPNATTLCLNGGRFRVTTSWATTRGDSGAGTGVKLTNDSGYFWFFNPANIELVVKVLNACGIAPGRFWVFAGGLTNVRVTMTVTDTTNGAVRVYENPLGTAFEPLQDTDAFTCP